MGDLDFEALFLSRLPFDLENDLDFLLPSNLSSTNFVLLRFTIDCPYMSRKIGTKIVIEDIVNEINPLLIAKLIPHRAVEIFSLIASNLLDQWKDILRENLGVWTPSGSKRFNYSTTFDRTRIITLKPSKKYTRY